MQRNYKKIYAIKKEHEKRLLKLNPKLDHESGIYFYIRKSEQNENEIYVGQSNDLLRRNIEHLSGYMYIDLSIKAHGLFSENNPYGYRLEFIHFPKELLNEKEQYYIKLYREKGWILKNKTSGSQGKGKEKIAEYKPAKGYREGVVQGRRNAAKEIAKYFDKYLEAVIKKPCKYADNALEKFKEFLKEGEESGG